VLRLFRVQLLRQPRNLGVEGEAIQLSGRLLLTLALGLRMGRRAAMQGSDERVADAIRVNIFPTRLDNTDKVCTSLLPHYNCLQLVISYPDALLLPPTSCSFFIASSRPSTYKRSP
jgi:hypothetical protein